MERPVATGSENGHGSLFDEPYAAPHSLLLKLLQRGQGSPFQVKVLENRKRELCFSRETVRRGKSVSRVVSEPLPVPTLASQHPHLRLGPCRCGLLRAFRANAPSGLPDPGVLAFPLPPSNLPVPALTLQNPHSPHQPPPTVCRMNTGLQVFAFTCL